MKITEKMKNKFITPIQKFTPQTKNLNSSSKRQLVIHEKVNLKQPSPKKQAEKKTPVIKRNRSLNW